MHQWTRARWISFFIHAGFVSIPFLASTASALLFWRALFDSWWLAAPMVAVVDVLALTGLVLFVARVPSPFVPLRHVLPFVSVVPLGIELYGLLAHNGMAIAVLITILVTAIATAIAWQCFRTIEQLFISPVEAAREKAREQLGQLTVELAQLTEKNAVVADFVTAWQHQTITATIQSDPPAAPPAMTARMAPALAQHHETDDESLYASVQTDGVASQSVQTTIADRTCKHCGQPGLTAIEVARHGRARKRSGTCPA